MVSDAKARQGSVLAIDSIAIPGFWRTGADELLEEEISEDILDRTKATKSQKNQKNSEQALKEAK